MVRPTFGGADRLIGRVPRLNTIRDVSSDRKVLLYSQLDEAGPGLHTFQLDAAQRPGNPQLVAESVQGNFSPGGRWIVYAGDGQGPRTQISSLDGHAPVWRSDGREILYLGSDETVYSVSVRDKGSQLQAGSPQSLFQVPGSMRPRETRLRSQSRTTAREFSWRNPLINRRTPKPTS